MPSFASSVASEAPTLLPSWISCTSAAISTVPLLIFVGMLRACGSQTGRLSTCSGTKVGICLRGAGVLECVGFPPTWKKLVCEGSRPVLPAGTMTSVGATRPTRAGAPTCGRISRHRFVS